MKFLLILPLFLLSVASAKDIVLDLELDPNKEPKNRNGDYNKQIIEKFDKVLKSNLNLKKQFEQFEMNAIGPEEGRGRYQGISNNSFLLHYSEDLNFQGGVGDTSTKKFTQVIVIHYFYNEGYRKGIESKDGIFAIFKVEGNLEYENLEDDGTKMIKNTVTATFQGFHKTLNAQQNPAK